MTRALHSELLKIRHTRSLLALLAAGVAYAAVSMLPPALASDAEKATWTADVLPGAVRGPMWLLAVLMLVFGVLLSAGEARHRTLPTTLLLIPRRSQVFAAKAAASALAAAAVGLAAGALSMVTAVSLLRDAGIDVSLLSGDGWSTAAAGAAVVVTYAVAGVGLGQILGNDTLAVAGSLVWITVIEGALPILLGKPELGDWLPGGTAARLMMVAVDGPFVVSLPSAAAVLVGVAGAMTAGGRAALTRRDVA